MKITKETEISKKIKELKNELLCIDAQIEHIHKYISNKDNKDDELFNFYSNKIMSLWKDESELKYKIKVLKELEKGEKYANRESKRNAN